MAMATAAFSPDAIFSDLRKQVDEHIAKYLHDLVEKHKSLTIPNLCYRTIENFVVNGGKRIRPICVLTIISFLFLISIFFIYKFFVFFSSSSTLKVITIIITLLL